MLLLDADIPDFLRASPYLQSVLEEGAFPEDGIDVPEGCAKSSFSIETKADLVDLLRTLRYWLLPELIENSLELLQYSFDVVNRSTVSEVCEEFMQDIPYLACLVEVLCSDDLTRTAIAAHGGYVKLLEYLYDEMGLETTETTAINAIGGGHLSCLQVMFSRGLLLTPAMYEAASSHGHLPCLVFLMQQDEFGLKAAVVGAARGGHFDCLKFLLDCVPGGRKQVASAYKCAAEYSQVSCLQAMLRRWKLPKHSDGAILLSAAKAGHVSVLMWGIEAGLPFDNPSRILSEAVANGHLSCVEYLHSLGHTATDSDLQIAGGNGHMQLFTFLLARNCPVSTHVCRSAAGKGHLNILKLARESGIPWDENTCSEAAHGGHLSCLQYAHESGCPWDKMTTHEAARMGHSECLQFAHEHGCPWETHAGEMPEHTPYWQEDICVSAARAQTIDCLDYVVKQGVFLRRGCATAAFRHKSVAVMRFLHDRHRFTWGAAECKIAASLESVDCLQFLHEICTPWDERVCETAVIARNMDHLRYAHEHGCPWDLDKCVAVAHDLHCVRYLHEARGCALTKRLVFAAAQAQDIMLLRYLHAHGCPWDEKACVAASARGDLTLLRYLHENGCPWSPDTCKSARTRSVYNYAVAHGCPGADESAFKDPVVFYNEDSTPDVPPMTVFHPPSTECIVG